MSHIIKRGNWYQYKRRVPKDIQEIFPKEIIQISLKTDSRSVAQTRAIGLDRMLEAHWDKLHYGNSHNEDDFKDALKRSRRLGFEYKTINEIVERSSPGEFANRIHKAVSVKDDRNALSVLGVSEKPSVSIFEAQSIYFNHEAGNLIGRSEDQIRKWENPRKRAIKNFHSIIGDKPLEEITREDILAYREWWVSRIQAQGGLSANTANKEFGFIRQALRAATDNYMLDVNVDALFKKIALKDTKKTSRPPFETQYIKDVLLNRGVMNINDECQLFIYAMADTGARVAELVGLEEQDIFLNDPVAHIKIRKNRIRSLKTDQSERDIPLVGSSLFAFQELKTGFVRYRGKADLLSSTINKYMRENNLLPSDKHSLYSLRHSFEDRLTAVEPPDKVQAALMGHKYVRPKYGAGPTLEQKKSWLDKIALMH